MGKKKKQQKKAKAKDKRTTAAVDTPAPPAAPSLALAPEPKMLKLDLGCGQNPKDGFEGVDLYGEKATHKVDLFKFPWPFQDATVDEIHCSHFLEHVPAREVEERDLSPQATAADRQELLGKDMLFAFMDECHRIMKPEAWMHVVVPSGRSSRAFWDPTHRRFFMQETFLYFAAEWRRINGLSHYRTKCNFGVDVGQTIPNEEALRSPEAQQIRFQHYWNVTVDWVAKLKKQP
jgi:hypothetical protein